MNTNIIYKIVCTTNSKFYIGRAVNFEKRMSIHKSRLRNNKHINKHLQNMWNKYGEQSFQFLIIENCQQTHLIEREQYYLDLYINDKNCVNISKSSNNNTSSSNIETRKKISASNMGKKHTDEAKLSMSKARKRMRLSHQTIQKIKEARKKQKMLKCSDKTKEKISKANSGESNSNAKLTWEIVRNIRKDFAMGVAPKELMVKYKCSFPNISNIIHNKRWKEHEQRKE